MELLYITFGAILGILLTYAKELLFDSFLYKSKLEAALLGIGRTKTDSDSNTWTLAVALKNSGKGEDTLSAAYIIEQSASDPLNYARDFSLGYFGFMQPVLIPADSIFGAKLIFQRYYDNSLHELLLKFKSGKEIRIEIANNKINSALAASDPTTATVLQGLDAISKDTDKFIQPAWFKPKTSSCC